MAHNFLQLNHPKSEIILFNPPSTICISFGPLSSNIKPTARNVGVILDSDFTFIPHINKVVQSCFLHIRITKIFFLLSQPNLEKLIHALIFSRLDYRNSRLTGINHKSLSHLQLVQNSAARLLHGFNRRRHITPVFTSLQWLPLCFRIDFKILLINFKARHGLAPDYITDMLTPDEPVRSLRSAGGAHCSKVEAQD